MMLYLVIWRESFRNAKHNLYTNLEKMICFGMTMRKRAETIPER